MASPVNSISLDHFCAIQLPLTQHPATESCVFTIICVYLHSSDHSLDEFSKYLSELECVVCALKSSGPVMLVGDFNAHLPNPSDDSVSGNQQGKLLSDIIQNHSLFVASTSSLSNGPNYTFFSGANRTTVDYIITDASLASTMCECRVHSHHPLNLSDHLPITISLLISSFLEFPSPTCTEINWAKSINSVGIQAYVQEISSVITPFLASTPPYQYHN